ncbi:MAG TPA: GNAT family N-acetyltransferase [Verrucomicrobiae bacterium]|nr:GNAT family N-acetyltransferase [Verrucomicrobiae bacterium]
MLSTGDELPRLRDDWRRLQATVRPLNPFLSWEWQWSWWEGFGSTFSPAWLVFRADAEVRGILPLHRDRAGASSLRIGGGLTLSDHLGFLAAPGWEAEVAAATVEWVAAGPSGGGLDLHFLPEDSPSLVELRAAAQLAGVPVSDVPEEVSPYLDVPSDFEAYLETGLGKKDRHELRRKRRRLDQEHPGWRAVAHAEVGLDAALDHFFALHRASHPDKAAFLTLENVAFFRGLARRLDEVGWLRIQLLVTADGPVAATFGFTVDRTWYLYNSGYDPAAARWSVGLLCVAEGVRAAIAEGCTRCDFLRGAEPYKYHLGARDRVLHHLRLGSGAEAPQGAPDGGPA